MNTKAACLFLCLLAAGIAGLAGCAASTPPVTYYSLLSPENIAGPPRQTKGFSLQIGPVIVSDLLHNSQIATQNTTGQYQMNAQHRWANALDRDLAKALGEDLAARLHTEQVTIYPFTPPDGPTWQVSIDVLTMAGVLDQEATLVVRWSLIDPVNKTMVLTRRTALSEQVTAGSGHAGWVVAQRHNLARLGAEIAAALPQKP